MRRLLWIPCLCAVSVAAAKSPAPPSGRYHLETDQGGAAPKPGAVVELDFQADGRVVFRGTGGGLQLSGEGTYKVHGDHLDFAMAELRRDVKNGAFSNDGKTLVLPFHVFGAPAGTSIWHPVANLVKAAAKLPAQFGQWDLLHDPEAGTMKELDDAMEGRGEPLARALDDAAKKAKTYPEVKEVTRTGDGKNLVLLLKNGEHLYAVTAALAVGPEPDSSGGCMPLPTFPQMRGDLKRKVPFEPGKEGIPIVSGLFGVTSYPQSLPTPLRSDAPVARRALIYAPLDGIGHEIVYSDHVMGLPSGFQGEVGYDSITCVQRSLERAGYQVDVIRGRLEDGKPVETGVAGLIQLTRYLKNNRYGAIYLATHGVALPATNIMGAGADDIRISAGYVEQDELAGYDRKARRLSSDAGKVILDKILEGAGLAVDDPLRATIDATSVELDGRLTIRLKSTYFSELRRQGAHFEDAIVAMTVCESASNDALRRAFSAKAFFGWANSPSLARATAAAEVLFDELADKVRSARAAWQMWYRHETWWMAWHGIKTSKDLDPAALKAYGKDGTLYPPIADQTNIFLYLVRHHGGVPVNEGLRKGVAYITTCNDGWWKRGKSAPSTTAGVCRAVQLGDRVPTAAEIADAEFELGTSDGDARQQAFGRFTLADDPAAPATTP